MISPMGEVSHWEGKAVLLIPVPTAGHQKQCIGCGGCKLTVKIFAKFMSDTLQYHSTEITSAQPGETYFALIFN